MTCARCNAPLERRQHAQPLVLGGTLKLERREPSFCDDCLRGHQLAGGSSASIERLLRGEIDSEEQKRLDDRRTPLWDEGSLPELQRIEWRAALPQKPKGAA